jgi:transcription antitermination factor NusG
MPAFWYVVQCKWKKHVQALHSAREALGESLWAPKEQVASYSNGQTTVKERYAFGTYLFCPVDLTLPENWQALHNARGIATIIGGFPPHPLLASQVQSLQACCDSEGFLIGPKADVTLVGFSPGDHVKVRYGEGAGQDGIVVDDPASPTTTRVYLILHLLSRNMVLYVHPSRLEKTEHPSPEEGDGRQRLPRRSSGIYGRLNH